MYKKYVSIVYDLQGKKGEHGIGRILAKIDIKKKSNFSYLKKIENEIRDILNVENILITNILD
jgi:hypothetical protein